jgi:hypothetical protein
MIAALVPTIPRRREEFAQNVARLELDRVPSVFVSDDDDAREIDTR